MHIHHELCCLIQQFIHVVITYLEGYMSGPKLDNNML